MAQSAAERSDKIAVEIDTSEGASEARLAFERVRRRDRAGAREFGGDQTVARDHADLITPFVGAVGEGLQHAAGERHRVGERRRCLLRRKLHEFRGRRACGDRAVDRGRAESARRGLAGQRLFEHAARFVARDQRRDQARERIAARLDHRGEQRDQNSAEMRRAAGVFLGAAVKQRGIGEARAADGGAAAVEKERRTACHFAVKRERGRACDRRIRRGMAVNAHAEGVVQTYARLLHDLGRHVLRAQTDKKLGEIGGEGRHDVLPFRALLTL